MSSILDSIEDTLNSTVAVDQLYEKYKEIDQYFLGATLKRENSGYPYFEINSVRDGIVLMSGAQVIFPEFLQKNCCTFPSWIEFRVKNNSYRKKYGGKTCVKLYTGHNVGYIQFGEENNFPFADTKQFDSCYVNIEKGIPHKISLEKIFKMEQDKKYGYNNRPEKEDYIWNPYFQM